MRYGSMNAKNAKEFALAAHGSQKYGDLPYEVHLAAVAAILGEIAPDLVPDGWLHDVLEDTSVTGDELAREFGEPVKGRVWACSGEGKNRRERNASIKAKLAMYPDAAIVKMADRLANMSASRSNPDKRRMYLREYPEFRAMAVALRPSLSASRQAEMDRLLALLDSEAL